MRAVTESLEAGRDPQWRVEDAPADYIEQQLKAIVGIEIEVVSIEGKAKLSQNRPGSITTACEHRSGGGTLGERIVAQRCPMSTPRYTRAPRGRRATRARCAQIRLESLADTPDAYGATYEESLAWSHRRWRTAAATWNYFLAERDGRRGRHGVGGLERVASGHALAVRHVRHPERARRGRRGAAGRGGERVGA